MCNSNYHNKLLHIPKSLADRGCNKLFALSIMLQSLGGLYDFGDSPFGGIK